MTRIYVPLDKNMSDAEVVQAMKDAAKKADAVRQTALDEAEGLDDGKRTDDDESLPGSLT